MNRRGERDGVLMANIMYIIVFVIFLGLMYSFVSSQREGASIWEDYYAKEICKIIDFAKPGDSITLDVHKATEIAKKNELRSFSEIFMIDNAENEVCVKLSRGRMSCYSYFNDVDIINLGIKLGVPGNVLNLNIIETQKTEEDGNEEE